MGSLTKEINETRLNREVEKQIAEKRIQTLVLRCATSQRKLEISVFITKNTIPILLSSSINFDGQKQKDQHQLLHEMILILKLRSHINQETNNCRILTIQKLGNVVQNK